MSDEVSNIFNVAILRDVKVPMKRFTDYFKGFEKVEAVKEIFSDNTEKVLKNLKVEFNSRSGYMGVSNDDGHLMVSALYLRTGDERDIYLDIIHELVHVRQFMKGIQLHDHRYNYSNRPTEIEAYAHTAKEARRIGMTEKEIYEYLKTEWMTDSDVNELAGFLNVKP